MGNTTANPASSAPTPGYPPLPPSATYAQQREYERNRWNHCLLDATWRQTRFNSAPNALLVEAVRGCRPGPALDVNMGEGRNALFLARQGWQVTGVDYAEKALDYAQQRARELRLKISILATDLASYDGVSTNGT